MRPHTLLLATLMQISVISVSSADGRGLSLPAGNCTGVLNNQALEYTLTQIAKAEVEFKPYPHVHIKNILLPKVYECMIANLPSKNKSGNSMYKALFADVKRFSIQLALDGIIGPSVASTTGRKKLQKLRMDDARFNVPFWTQWARVFGSDKMKMAYVQKMKPTLMGRSPKAMNIAKKCQWNMALNRDVTGYEIGPHTDSRGKWVTVLYYLPPDANAPKTAGTCVLRSKSGKTQPGSSEWENWKNPDFEIVRQAEFVPNSVFVFASCHSSWHAVPKINEKYLRDTIQAFVASPKAYKLDKQKCPTQAPA